MILRTAKRSDLKKIHQLICELEEKDFPLKSFAGCFLALLRDHAHTIIVAEENSVILGMIHLRIEAQMHHCGKIAEIVELVVLPEYRSRGIGSKLVSAAEESAGNYGCIGLEVTPAIYRTDAYRFYKRHHLKQTHMKLCKNISAKSL